MDKDARGQYASVNGLNMYYEVHGAEDPRVTEIDGTYYLTYSGYDGTRALLCLATSTDLLSWTKHGPLFPDFNTFLPQGNGLASSLTAAACG